jgi:type VI secretion system protein ImpB
LLETRNRLRDLMSKADRSEELELLLEQILKDKSQLATITGELGLGEEH